jgi:hypothetical protein
MPTKRTRRAEMAPRLPKHFAWRLLLKIYQDLHPLLPEGWPTPCELSTRGISPEVLTEFENRAYASIQARLPHHQVAVAWQVGHVFRKFAWPGLVPASEKRLRAISATKEAEQACRQSSRRLRKASNVFLDLVRYYVDLILGDPPTLDEIADGARHGPGAALCGIDGKSRRLSLLEKYRDWPYCVTSRAAPILKQAIAGDLRWLGALEDSYRERNNIRPWEILDWEIFWTEVLNIIPGAKIGSVPKDWSKDRPIAIEPLGNMFLQLGLGTVISDRLFRRGFTVDEQAWNAILAFQGSYSGELATIDLSNASDSISLRLVREVVSPAWFQLLFDTRSPRAQYPGEAFPARCWKVSSMGNGFTFPLETCIFAAIAAASMHEGGLVATPRVNLAVYGDDIVLPSTAAQRLERNLRWCGLSVNAKKSYTTGPFRESCGYDWYEGRLIRNVSLLGNPLSTTPDLITFHNGLYMWACEIFGLDSVVDPCDLLTTSLPYIRSHIPEWNERLGPPNPDERSSYLFSFEKEDRSIVLFSRFVLATKPPREWFWGRLLKSHSPNHRLKSALHLSDEESMLFAYFRSLEAKWLPMHGDVQSTSYVDTSKNRSVGRHVVVRQRATKSLLQSLRRPSALNRWFALANRDKRFGIPLRGPRSVPSTRT